MKYWYAVLKNKEDNDWGTGSYLLSEAINMAKMMECEIIAVIAEGKDPICVAELHRGIDF